jgi:hypothetical protein
MHIRFMVYGSGLRVGPVVEGGKLHQRDG